MRNNDVIQPSPFNRIWQIMLISCMVLLLPAQVVAQENVDALKSQIEQLEQQLQAAKAALSAAEAQQHQAEQRTASVESELAEASAERPGITFGNLNIGGAMRANYVIGDYPKTNGASRAVEDGGNFELDTFRINLDYQNGPIIGKAEYRWYNGYNFLHTGWLGYQFDDNRQLQVGVNRVPFGPGPYGVSQSWLFDQHYYVGLADDMDLGVKFTQNFDNWTLDTAYYLRDEGAYIGSSKESARYSYDVVNESGNGYEERNQFNLRAIRHFKSDKTTTDLGISLQYSDLKSKGPQNDGDHVAASIHIVNKWQDFTLATQLTYYNYDVDARQPLGTDKLVQMGAYDFPSTAAAKVWIPAISLSYFQQTPGIAWLDYVIPYIEYSSIIKEESSFNDSQLATLGAAFGYANWYIYTDLSSSTGNEFIGGDTPFGDRLGANSDDDWQARFNINFGYYF